MGGTAGTTVPRDAVLGKKLAARRRVAKPATHAEGGRAVGAPGGGGLGGTAFGVVTCAAVSVYAQFEVSGAQEDAAGLTGRVALDIPAEASADSEKPGGGTVWAGRGKDSRNIVRQRGWNCVRDPALENDRVRF